MQRAYIAVRTVPLYWNDVLLGGYSSEVPPLPIPNREVKLTHADGTAFTRGRVGSRLFKGQIARSAPFFCCCGVWFCFVRCIPGRIVGCLSVAGRGSRRRGHGRVRSAGRVLFRDVKTLCAVRAVGHLFGRLFRQCERERLGEEILRFQPIKRASEVNLCDLFSTFVKRFSEGAGCVGNNRIMRTVKR